jgi:hypothetical protein
MPWDAERVAVGLLDERLVFLADLTPQQLNDLADLVEQYGSPTGIYDAIVELEAEVEELKSEMEGEGS